MMTFVRYAYCQPIIYILNAAFGVDLERNTDYVALHLILLSPVHFQTCSTKKQMKTTLTQTIFGMQVNIY